MIVTVASYKGGVGKTTSSIHLAAFFATRGPTVLVDADLNRSALNWARRAEAPLPFAVVDEKSATKLARDAEFVVVDTAARPQREELEALLSGTDLLVLPCSPDPLSIDAMLATTEALQALGSTAYKILMTIVAPRPSRDGEEARAAIEGAGLPIFRTSIRRLVCFQRAALAGVVVSAIKDPRAADGWSDYESVGREIIS